METINEGLIVKLLVSISYFPLLACISMS
uniref:Uncharacterized protein n=1 Tax=Rhizophora mucronata TaxID=61149 RepID=A0A2P2IZH8_RHIMU